MLLKFELLRKEVASSKFLTRSVGTLDLATTPTSILDIDTNVTESGIVIIE